MDISEIKERVLSVPDYDLIRSGDDNVQTAMEISGASNHIEAMEFMWVAAWTLDAEFKRLVREFGLRDAAPGPRNLTDLRKTNPANALRLFNLVASIHEVAAVVKDLEAAVLRRS